MKISTQIVFKNMAPSAFAHIVVDEEAEKLSEYGISITHCRVSIERSESHEFRSYKIQAFLNLAGGEMSVELDTQQYPDCNRLGLAIHEVFSQIRHRLLKQKQAHVKTQHRAPGLKHIATRLEPAAI